MMEVDPPHSTIYSVIRRAAEVRRSAVTKGAELLCATHEDVLVAALGLPYFTLLHKSKAVSKISPYLLHLLIAIFPCLNSE